MGCDLDGSLVGTTLCYVPNHCLLTMRGRASTVAVPSCNTIWKHTCCYNKMIEKILPYSIRHLKISRLLLLLVFYDIFSFVLRKCLERNIPQCFFAAFIEPQGRKHTDALVKNQIFEWVKIKWSPGSQMVHRIILTSRHAAGKHKTTRWKNWELAGKSPSVNTTLPGN